MTSLTTAPQLQTLICYAIQPRPRNMPCPCREANVVIHTAPGRGCKALQQTHPKDNVSDFITNHPRPPNRALVAQGMRVGSELDPQPRSVRGKRGGRIADAKRAASAPASPWPVPSQLQAGSGAAGEIGRKRTASPDTESLEASKRHAAWYACSHRLQPTTGRHRAQTRADAHLTQRVRLGYWNQERSYRRTSRCQVWNHSDAQPVAHWCTTLLS
ncbi:hypothetical protein GWK47_052784 [Chionoecetes opilio]|uniref:Uncharacterized protein n=1 Tax=Chionoecetes opilio TaxID=41210 RepID=A0A8J4XZZ1_CHIOP|nr:hypothetical protein GWK47_052784 [Chionoecetes opilio]